MSKRRGLQPTAGPPRDGRSRRRTQRRDTQDDVRVAAAWVLERTLDSRAPVDSFLDSALTRFEARDQGLMRELVLGTLRWLRRLDYILAAAGDRKFGKIEPALRAPLRIGAYQLLFLDRIPSHAAVNEAVEEALRRTHRGGASFANAVLRRIARSPSPGDWPVADPDPIRRLAISLSHPDFLVRRWVERLGRERALEVMQADNRPKPMQLLAFKDRGGRELLAEALIDAGIDVEPSAVSALGLTVRSGDPLAAEAFRRGDFYIQDEVSQLAALIPPPRPGERILDAAAAPGGKSFALWAREPEVVLTLADLSLLRLAPLRRNLERLGRRAPMLLSDAGAPALAGRFDRVVLDLPCSGTGTLRKHPELKWRISESEISRLAGDGLRLLHASAPLVAPGGLLVAITCSLEAEENEGVAARFLDSHQDFEPFRLEDSLEHPLADGVEGPGRWRMLTGGDHDGFTVNVLRKRA